MSNIAPGTFDATDLVDQLKSIRHLEEYVMDHVSTAITPSIREANYVVISKNLGSGPFGEVSQPIVHIFKATRTRYLLVPLEGVSPNDWAVILRTFVPKFNVIR